MKLSELFQQLALGELAGSPLVEINGYELDRQQLPKVIVFINQALEYFYSNFPIKTNEVVIELQQGITRYYLDSDYAYSSGSNGIKFILDTPDNPFRDDVLHVYEVIGTNGISFTINDNFSEYNVNIPEYNCIQIENTHGSEYLLIKYMAKHPDIKLTEQLDSNVEINIPSSYRSALQTYVACLLFNSMGGSHLQESNALFAKFKTLTDELKLSGIGTLTQTGVNIKPQLRGWV